MCGILAVYNKKKLFQSQNYYNKFLKIINHRGPDSSSFFVSDNVFLGFNRLKILDLSDKANMPMIDESNRYILVFNGEIYNFKNLKSKLLGEYKFKSTSDSEVILAGYKKFGKNFFKRMSGMWSIIIYDKLENKFIISRDRFGIKPLYYCIIDQEYYFASEQKVLIEIINSQKGYSSLNLNYATNYILYGNCDFKDETLYKEIKLIKEASIYELKKELKFVEEYYSIDFTKKKKFDEKEFNTLFNNCLSEHLNSDVNISCTLSSGIDSSTIFHVYRNFFKREIMPFSLKFDFFDDKEFSTILDRENTYGYKNQYVDIKSEKLKVQFDHFLNMMDEPFVSDNLFYQSILTKEVKNKGNKVLYVGDGADEFFLGYDKFYYLYIIYLFKEFRILTFLNYIFNNKIGINLKNIFSSIFNYFLNGNGKRSVLTNHYGKKIINNKLQKNKIFQYYKLNRNFNNIIDEEIFSRLKYDVIKFNKNSDITGMMNSVEVRVPYLDHRIVDYLLSINLDTHFKNFGTKQVLKNFSKKFLPLEIINQKKKLKKPGSIKKFVYKILDQDILNYLDSESNPQIFNKGIKFLYLKDKKNMNLENSFVWFRYYQVNKLIDLKKLK